jgi:hypothetical protein
MRVITQRLVSQNIEFNESNLLEIYEKQNFESVKPFLNSEFNENSNFHFFLKSLIVNHIPALITHTNKLGNFMKFFMELRIFYSKGDFDKKFEFLKISDEIISDLKEIQPEKYGNLIQQFSLFLHSGSLIDVSFLTRNVLSVYLNCNDEIQKKNISQFLIVLF